MKNHELLDKLQDNIFLAMSIAGTSSIALEQIAFNVADQKVSNEQKSYESIDSVCDCIKHLNNYALSLCFDYISKLIDEESIEPDVKLECENEIAEQKQIIVSILKDIEEPQIVKKIFTYIMTITN